MFHSLTFLGGRHGITCSAPSFIPPSSFLRSPFVRGFRRPKTFQKALYPCAIARGMSARMGRFLAASWPANHLWPRGSSAENGQESRSLPSWKATPPHRPPSSSSRLSNLHPIRHVVMPAIGSGYEAAKLRWSLCVPARTSNQPSFNLRSTFVLVGARWVPGSSGRSATRLKSLKSLAGAPGFEPGNGGIKIRCLTTWLRPSSEGAAP
jgi:hypothetical protein